MQESCSQSSDDANTTRRISVETSPLHRDPDDDDYDYEYKYKVSNCNTSKCIPAERVIDKRIVRHKYSIGAEISVKSAPNSPLRRSLLQSVKKQIAMSMEHCNNVVQDIAAPLLSKKRRISSSSKKLRSASASRIGDNGFDDGLCRHPIATDSTHSDDDDMDDAENIELSHLNGFAVRSKRESSKGHHFISVQLMAPSWCDKCGDFIWGVYKQCLKCKNCEYTCHHECRQHVSIDCSGTNSQGSQAHEAASSRPGSRKETTRLSTEPPAQQPQAIICSASTVWFFKRTPSRRHFLAYPVRSDIPVESTVVEDDADSGYHTGDSVTSSGSQKTPGEWTLTREDLLRRIDAFNLNSHGLHMTIDQGSNTFQGSIRIHMNLIRPINMSLTVRQTNVYELLSHDAPVPDGRDSQLASFYLPKDTTKLIHVLSDTTVYEVIRCLLTKFRITDNPRKFALYEKTMTSAGKTVLRRMMDDETPLPICLAWTAHGLNQHKFLLQENDAGEIHWDAFSIPELERFLTILDREEAEYVEQIKAKYQLMRVHVDRRLGILEKQQPQRDGVFV